MPLTKIVENISKILRRTSCQKDDAEKDHPDNVREVIKPGSPDEDNLKSAVTLEPDARRCLHNDNNETSKTPASVRIKDLDDLVASLNSLAKAGSLGSGSGSANSRGVTKGPLMDMVPQGAEWSAYFLLRFYFRIRHRNRKVVAEHQKK